jgi:ABC-2 type transport system ATP-binding protein
VWNTDAVRRNSVDPTAEADAVVRVAGLRKAFGDRTAVEDVSLTITTGETYGLLGPNGAGKTTTISMVAGLIEPDAGDVHVAGRPVTPRTVAARAAIGLVPQELAVYPDLTARENLTFFARLYGLRGRHRKDRVDEVLDVVGLGDRADDLTRDYSGGMQRRLNIGVGLLHQPRLLILDEPTVGVDPQSRNAILSSVEQLAGEGMAVLYTTHYMEEAERLCDRIGIIDQGRIRAEGTRRELVALVGENDQVNLGASGPLHGVVTSIGRLEGVESASVRDGGLEVVARDAAHLLPRLLTEVAGAGAQVSSIEVLEPDLESVFLHLTGRALRD